MKKRIIKISSLLLMILLLCVSLTFFVKAGSFSTVTNKVLKDCDIIEGVHWYKKNITSTDEEGTTDTFLTNVVEITPGSAEIVSWAVVGGNQVKRMNVYNIAMDYEVTHPGKKVVAAINDDYFGTTNGVLSTRNPLVIDGRVVNANPDATAKKRLYTMALNPDLSLNADNNLPYYLSEKGENYNVSDNYYLDIINNGEVIDTISLDEFNKNPSANGTTFTLNTVVTASGNEKMFALTTLANANITNTVAYENTVGDVYYIRGYVNTKEVEASLDNNVTIISSNEKVINELKNSSSTIIYKKITGKFANYKSIFAAQQPTMLNGEILAKEDIFDYGSHRDIRRARTTIGFKADGTMCFLTTDEAGTSGTKGTSLRESASILKEYGCVSSFNLDGGGSTCIYCLQNGKLALQNAPSDGEARSVGNAILVVKDDLTKDDIHATYTQDKGKVNVSVTFDRAANSVQSACVYANTKKYELEKNGDSYTGTIKLEDEINTKVYTGVTYTTIEGKNSVLTTNPEYFSYQYEKIPADFNVILNEFAEGKYEVSITYDAHSTTVNSIKIKENDKEILYTDKVTIDSKIFSLIVNYSYLDDTKEITVNDYELTVNNNIPIDDPIDNSETKKTGCNKGIDILSCLLVLPLLGIICGFRIIKSKKEE